MIFTWTPAPGASLAFAPRIKAAQFGDGYSQRVRDGINNMPRSWAVRFARATSDIDAIEDFLTSVGADISFDWTPPKGVSGKWLCRSWNETVNTKTVQEISATFEEVFE